MTGRREAHHAELVHRTPPPAHRREEVEGRARRHPHVVDRVVPARGALEPEDVPVPRELHLGRRHQREEQLRVGAVGRLGHHAGADPRRVPHPAAEVVVARDPVAVTVRGGDAVRCELAGGERDAVGEQRLREVVGRPRPEERDRGRVRHQAPSRGAVGAGDLREHVDGIHHRALRARPPPEASSPRADRHRPTRRRWPGAPADLPPRGRCDPPRRTGRGRSRGASSFREHRGSVSRRAHPPPAPSAAATRASTARIVSGSWAPVIGKRPSTTKKGTPVIPISSARASSARTASL